MGEPRLVILLLHKDMHKYRVYMIWTKKNGKQNNKKGDGEGRKPDYIYTSSLSSHVKCEGHFNDMVRSREASALSSPTSRDWIPLDNHHPANDITTPSTHASEDENLAFMTPELLLLRIPNFLRRLQPLSFVPNTIAKELCPTLRGNSDSSRHGNT